MKTPIVHVAEVLSLKQLTAEANRLEIEEGAAVRASLKRRMRLGELFLKIKDKVGHGRFAEHLQANLRTETRTAQRWMTLARHKLDKSPEAMTLEQIDEVIQADNEEDSDGQIRHMSHLENDATPVPDVSTNEKTPAQDPDNIQSGEPAGDGEKPASKRTEFPHGASAPPPVTTPERQPGDDHSAAGEPGQPKGTKNGWVVFDWKIIEAPFGQLVRAVDAWGTAYGVKNAPETSCLRAKLSDFLDSLKKLHQRISKQKAPE